ncbi:hypothetical protein AYL99_03990 [Fonsecaea erecta]|uniref:LYR motif-containing protein 2 n=1 Tax=Fonsecaea erecta TaxID=1367422 RepID=A0A178ZPR8_9EURO|nr:hypothetical protein AYL99_03990 [Fonsecaea erecta]OAP61787.1 hypothetical protein AYL99_03990 [Fonsecaea erecta]
MAEYTALFDDLDLETANLILKLQLEEIEDLRTNSKDKHRAGALSDAHEALSLFEENLKNIRSALSDRQMTQSIADAVQADAEAIADVIREEEVACEDHTLAHRLNGSNVTSEVHLHSSDLSGKTLARLAGRYVSERVGCELFEDTKISPRQQEDDFQAESSMRGSGRKQAPHKTRNLRCIICDEYKKFFDVIEVPCSHAYCKPCLQKLVELASKDESLFPPRCCRQPFEMDVVDIFLTKDLRDQFEHAKAEFAIKSSTPSSRFRKSPPLSLDHFIQRQRVLSLYRDILRSLYRHMSPPQRGESIAYAKGEFTRNKDVQELDKIRYLISMGKAEWDGVRRGVEEMGPARG